MLEKQTGQVARRWNWRISADNRLFFTYPELRNAQGPMPRLSNQLATLLEREANARLKAAQVAPVASSPAEARVLAVSAGYDFLITLRSEEIKLDSAAARANRVDWVDEQDRSAGVAMPVLYARVFDLRSGQLLDTLRIGPAQRMGLPAPGLHVDQAVQALLAALIHD